MKQHYKINTKCGARFTGVLPNQVDQILRIIIGAGFYRSFEGFVYESNSTPMGPANVLAVVEMEGEE